MPLTAKGSEIKSKMQETYGAKKGEQVFYASKNAGTISGVDAAQYGARRGRDVFFGARDNQPGLVSTPNASVPGFATIAKRKDDDDAGAG